MNCWPGRLSGNTWLIHFQSGRPRYDGKGISSHRTIISAANTPNVEEVLLHLAAYPHLQKDIGFLVDMFGCLFELNMSSLRLAPLTHAMSPRFHVDRIPCA